MISIEKHIPLKEHGTFRIGGPARFFAVVNDAKDVQEAVTFSRSAGVPFFVIGGGSNMLFGDAGFDGLVISMKIAGVAAQGECVIAGAGVVWDELVAWTVSRGFSGLENLSGIPGSVGGAVVGNIGAYGREIKDVLRWVEVFDGTLVRRLSAAECQFAYRTSVFKSQARRLVVVAAAFELGRRPTPAISYPDLVSYFKTHEIPSSKITPRAVRNAVLEIRAAKLPDMSRFGTAGSFFKNPVVGASVFEDLKKRFPEMPGFVEAESVHRVKIPAGWILDKICGYKGKRWDAVGTHEHQALVLVNFGGASAAAVAAAAREMAVAVKAATGISLEREVEYLF